MNKKSWFIFMAVLVLPFLLSPDLRAQERQRYGLSFGFGAGLANFPSEDSSKFYKEFQIIADIGVVRAGLTEGGASNTAPWSDNPLYPDITGAIQAQMFLADFALFPLRFKSPLSPFQVFAGFCVGFGFGDYAQDFIIGPQVGIELILGNILILGFETRYIFGFAKTYKFTGYNVEGNYWNLIFNLRFRVPLTRKQS